MVFLFYGVSLCGPLDQLKVLELDDQISRKSTAYALFIQAAIYENEGNLDDAKKIYLDVMDYDKSEFIRLKYVDILVKEGKFDKALVEIDDILKKNPESAKAYLQRGSISIVKRDYKKAEEAFLKAIEYGEKDFMVHMSLAQLYISTDKNQKALEMLEKAITYKPDNPIILFQAGMLYLKTENYEKGLDILKRAESLKPDWIEVKVTIAKIHEILKNYDSAIAKYNDILELYPLNKSIFLKIATLYQQTGQLKDALSVYKTLIELDTENFVYYVQASLLEFHLGLHDDGLETLKKAVKNGVKTADIYYLMGRHYLAKKDMGQASVYFEKSIEKNPKDIDAHLQLAYTYETLEKKDQVRTVLEKAIAIAPEDSEVLNYLGYFYAENDIELEKAFHFIEKALAIKPESGAYLDSMGWVLFKMNNFEKALEYLIRSIEKAPNDPIILEHLGIAILVVVLSHFIGVWVANTFA